MNTEVQQQDITHVQIKRAVLSDHSPSSLSVADNVNTEVTEEDEGTLKKDHSLILPLRTPKRIDTLSCCLAHAMCWGETDYISSLPPAPAQRPSQFVALNFPRPSFCQGPCLWATQNTLQLFSLAPHAGGEPTGGGIPHWLFGLCLDRPNGQRPGHQLLAIVPHSQTWLQMGTVTCDWARETQDHLCPVCPLQ